MRELTDRHWDAVVIGTGMGGGVAGRALAEAGLSVLFVEKGRAGWRREANGTEGATDPVARGVRGLWPDPVTLRMGGREREVFAPLGMGVGGSSVFYAATLERPEPHDLDPSNAVPHPVGGWPVRYAAMAPWFDAAERMFAVRGGADPLSAVACPELGAAVVSDADRAMMAHLAGNGMHPYALHAALRDVAGCASCLGRKCPRPCKMDGRSAGVEPALATGRAAMLDRCDVTRLVMDGNRVAGIEAVRDGARVTLRAARVVLAAGALNSPLLLRRSACEGWADGVANRSGMVGRNLMFHLNETFAVWPKGAERGDGPSKAVGFRDLYAVDGRRMGMVQAMGIDAGRGEIAHYMGQRIAGTWAARLPGARRVVQAGAVLAHGAMGRAKLFVGLLEDMPDAGNRVFEDRGRPGRIVVEYRVADEAQVRRRMFRRAIRSAFAGRRMAFVNRGAEPNLGHPCGTVRMGDDPAVAPLDAGCRAHGIENLWCVDAGVFPTSMGVNPSLTIAANALRVVEGMRHG